MPNTEKQLTAMQVLYNRNQEIIDKLKNTNDPHEWEYRKALVSVNDDITTELLATERQQLIDFYKQGQHDAPPIRETDAEQYFNQTFKTQ